MCPAFEVLTLLVDDTKPCMHIQLTIKTTIFC